MNAQKICIIGDGLAGLSAAAILSQENIKIDLYSENIRKNKLKRDNRTTAISESNFQFIRNISTSNIDLIDKYVIQNLGLYAQNFVKELNCNPLEGKLSFIKGELHVDIGKKQGLKVKQIGLVKGLNIKNSMLSNSSVILHANKIYENHSTLLPLNDKIKLNSLENLIVEFSE